MKLFAALALVLTISSCTPMSSNVAPAEADIVAGVCSVWLTITYDSVSDTAETVKEVQANNRARAAYCEGVD